MNVSYVRAHVCSAFVRVSSVRIESMALAMAQVAAPSCGAQLMNCARVLRRQLAALREAQRRSVLAAEQGNYARCAVLSETEVPQVPAIVGIGLASNLAMLKAMKDKYARRSVLCSLLCSVLCSLLAALLCSLLCSVLCSLLSAHS